MVAPICGFSYVRGRGRKLVIDKNWRKQKIITIAKDLGV
jgi:hypothetical protein